MLLSNQFVFYVDHMALVYLINKPHVSNQIVKWLLFLEYDFKIVYKPSRFHLMANVLSRLPMCCQTTNTHLFTLQLEWLELSMITS
jgi:hypothetical protein